MDLKINLLKAREYLEIVDEPLRNLSNPQEVLTTSYNKAQKLYVACQELVDLAQNSQGNL